MTLGEYLNLSVVSHKMQLTAHEALKILTAEIMVDCILWKGARITTDMEDSSEPLLGTTDNPSVW